MSGPGQHSSIKLLAPILLYFLVMKILAPRSVVIPRILRSMRLGRKMSQAKLAKSLNVSSNYIYLLEAGRKFPSLKFSLNLAKIFEINPNWIKCAWIRDYLSWVRVKTEIRIGNA